MNRIILRLATHGKVNLSISCSVIAGFSLIIASIFSSFATLSKVNLKLTILFTTFHILSSTRAFRSLAWSDFFSLCQSKFVPQVKKVKLLRQKRCGLLKEMFDHCDRLPWANSIFCVRSAMIRKSSSLSLSCVSGSVTRLGDLLDFGQLFKTFGNN